MHEEVYMYRRGLASCRECYILILACLLLSCYPEASGAWHKMGSPVPAGPTLQKQLHWGFTRKTRPSHQPPLHGWVN